MLQNLVVFGAGGLACQIIDAVPPNTRFVTDEGGGEFFGRPVEMFDPASGGALVIAVSNTSARRRIAAVWRGGFAQVFASSAEVSPHARLGKGAILCRQAIVEAGVTVGRHVHLNDRAIVGHGSQVGDFCTIGPGAIICGDCRIGDEAHIGAGAIIHQGITIGDGAFIGMGSLVSKDVPAGARVICGRIFNVPAVALAA